MPEIKRFHEIPGALHIECEEPCAYFIAFEKEEKASGNREDSAFFTSLCGEWDFAFFENAARLDIEKEGFPSSVACSDKITVPGNWQLCFGRGYDVPNYINQDYPYPVDPPYIPDVIACGFYRRTVALPLKEGKKYFMNFEGVSSCFYLWVNGFFAAYSQVSHASSVIEISKYLKNGQNTFEVLAVKHCDGSYFEDQDFFRLSGIFREVYITERDERHIKDIDLRATVAESLKSARLKAEISGVDSFDFKLVSPRGETVCEGDNLIDISIENPELWNYETPCLYSLYIHSGSEYICLPVGFKRFEIKNSAVLLNGKKVKAKGINRHDFNPETGYWVTPEQMLSELYSLKRANVNTIRTSHYPNDPRFLEMCDRLGFMVVDEADLETHGMGYNFGDWYWDYWSHLTDSPEYEEACVDRAKLLFERDKNHACVIMWSLGNESGCGENHRKMAQYIRSRRKDAVIHYENARLEYQERLGKDFTDISDVESRMYASIDYLKEYLDNSSLKKPFFYCEYVDSMSTGEIAKHWRGFEENDKYFGGCVWEYGDHAVNTGTKENPKYRYGGDFGDYPNDGICCLDGLVYPDRSERPGYYDMKKVYQPFEITYEDGIITVFNKRFFTDFSDLYIEWSVEKNGEVAFEGSIENPAIAPRCTAQYSLFDVFDFDCLTTLNVYVKQKTATEWADKGFETGFEQFILCDKATEYAPKPADPVTFTETRTDIFIKCGKIKYSFDRVTGRIAQIEISGKKILSQPLSFNLIRAATYNTKHYLDIWARARYDHIGQKTYCTSVKTEGSDVVVSSRISLASPAMPPAVKADVTYTFSPDGGVTVRTDAKVTYNAPPLPRFGIKLVMPGAFSQVKYLGFGPKESYAERHGSARLSLYETTPAADYEHYIKPQECSSHYSTRYASVTDGSTGLEFFTRRPLCFKAIPYDDLTIHNTLHDDELPEPENTFINLDYKIHAGITGEPGEYPGRVFDDKEFSFEVTIVPFRG